MGDQRMRDRHKQLRRRVRWFERKYRFRQNAINRDPRLMGKFHLAWDAACRADHIMWERIREDAQIKAALGAEDAPRRRPVHA